MGYFYPNGLSNKSGAHSLLRGAIYTSVRVMYVDSVNGSVLNPGSYGLPKDKLDSADETARIVVLKDGHAETVTSAIALKSCTVVGETVSGGKPTASLTMDASGASMVSPVLAGQQFINVDFPAQEQSNSSAVFDISADGWRFVSCTFEATVSDAGMYVDFGSSANSRVEECVFEATASDSVNLSSFPALNADSVSTSLLVKGCTFDVGERGFKENSGLGFVNLDAAPGARLEGLSLLRGTPAISTKGIIASGTLTQGAQIDTGASPQVFTGGLSDPSASSDTYLRADTLVATNDVIFVDSANGDDSNDGGFAAPLATIKAAADAVSASEALIVVRSGHRETLSAYVDIDQDYVTIAAEDDVEISVSGGAGVRVSGDGCEIRNVKFTMSAALGLFTYGVDVTGSGLRLYKCSFSATESVLNTFVNVGDAGDYLSIEGCSFAVSDGVSAATMIALSNTVVAPLIKDTAFTGQCTTASVFGRATLLRGEGVVLRDGASFELDSSSSGYLQVDADPSCPVEVF